MKPFPQLVLAGLLVLAAGTLAAQTINDAGQGRVDLALGKPVVGAPICKPGEEASKAVNGKVASKTQDKFCTLQRPGWLRVDLERPTAVSGFTIKHAGAGDEPVSMNTRAFKLRVSLDGKTWKTVVTEHDNTASVTHHPIATQQVRYVELDVSEPTQTDDPATRIYELEVW